MFKHKHTSTNELRKGAFVFFMIFGGLAITSMVSYDFVDNKVSYLFIIATIFWGVLSIDSHQSFCHRRNIEIQCKIAKVELLDYCPCKACRVRRNELEIE